MINGFILQVHHYGQFLQRIGVIMYTILEFSMQMLYSCFLSFKNYKYNRGICQQKEEWICLIPQHFSRLLLQSLVVYSRKHINVLRLFLFCLEKERIYDLIQTRIELPLQMDELSQMDEYIHHQQLSHSLYHLPWTKDGVKYAGIEQGTTLSISETFC